MKRRIATLPGLLRAILVIVPLSFAVAGCGKQEADDPSYYKGKDFKVNKGKTGPNQG